MFKTRTGGYSIGIRRGWSDWQKDLGTFTGWAKEVGSGVLEFGSDYPEFGQTVVESGFAIGSVDLTEWRALFSPDAEKRAAAVAQNAELVTKSAALGAKNFFIVVLPEDTALPRSENLKFAIESFSALAPALEAVGGRVVIEGWPGPGALGCTPETYRAILSATPACIGINYDPSHLIRMGIDPLRFLNEFADRVYHVHGKDAVVSAEAIYEYGTEQPATLKENPGFGGPTWRYTIPGHGQMDWSAGLKILQARGYSGAISIELEDENFNGTEAGEKAGLLASLNFLASV